MANPEHVAKLKEDVEAFKSGKAFKDIDLSGADLSGLVLVGVNLIDANLEKANLSGADLNAANLKRTNLKGANLSGAALIEADLSNANLSNTNLSGAYLIQANLSGADLEHANLSSADLEHANLSGADLFEANLSEANLNYANLAKADLLSANLNGVELFEAKLSQAILYEPDLNQKYKLRHGVWGVNGICNDRSAAIVSLLPRPADMLDSDPDAIISSLTRARKYFGYSFAFALLTLAIILLGLEEVEIPYFAEVEAKVEDFSLFALLFSAGSLFMTRMFMKDALAAARYINTKSGAMKVGRFPWALSRFTGEVLYGEESNRKVAKAYLERVISFITRLGIIIHPLIYLWIIPPPGRWYEWGIGVLLMALCVLVFLLSQQFQRPILYDRGAMQVLTYSQAIQEQTKVIQELRDVIDKKVSQNERSLRRRS